MMLQHPGTLHQHMNRTEERIPALHDSFSDPSETSGYVMDSISVDLVIKVYLEIVDVYRREESNQLCRSIVDSKLFLFTVTCYYLL